MRHKEIIQAWAYEIVFQRSFLHLASLFAPEKIEGYQKTRIGSAGDGGYVMIDDFKDIDLALSLGIENNVDWDLDVVNRGIHVQQYDHSVHVSPAQHERLKFFKTKIVASSDDPDGISISTILREAKVAKEASVLLKIDIESDEWGVFDACSLEDLKKFSQILVEFHDFDKAKEGEWLKRAVRVMEKLKSLFGVYHIHANNWNSITFVGNVPFPEVLEVSFANRARYSFSESCELFPTPLDRPNNSLRADLYLGAFKYHVIDHPLYPPKKG